MKVNEKGSDGEKGSIGNTAKVEHTSLAPLHVNTYPVKDGKLITIIIHHNTRLVERVLEVSLLTPFAALK